LGGGQLGRMLALAAGELGLKTHIYCPDPDSPAFEVTRRNTVAEYTDEAALDLFARDCDVITYEFENIPSASAAFLRSRRLVFPGVRALEVAQDRLVERQTMESLSIPVAAYQRIDSLDDLKSATKKIGLPAILKTRRFGYDGKGQAKIEANTDLAEAWAMIGETDAILEAFVPFAHEISVIAARGAGGEFVAYDPPKNIHVNHILHQSLVPAPIDPDIVNRAMEMAHKVAAHLDYVGILAIELFVLNEGAPQPLIVNEIAPRVHNSGHWTIDACLVSQFEQHIRAIAGWPLGPVYRHSDVEMTNLIGQDIQRWEDLLHEPNACLHLYGKNRVRSGRKMGHVTRLLPKS
ncbi:MAG: 5-(carboxyamino)imidazole ribonucleotide synthase, partial [Fimbriimonadaceae bacterium]|nr:5-(carboxyamino)imidazole ribonucleotide synthase [Alphaproteobacteria bacterium]